MGAEAADMADDAGGTTPPLENARRAQEVHVALEVLGEFQVLLEAAPDAIIGVDRDGRIAVVNAQTERLFGYERHELLGESIEVLVPEHARAAHSAHRTAFFRDPHPRPMGAGLELAGRRKDGSEFPAEISLSGIETKDGLLVSAAVRDITDRRRAAEAQAQLASIVQSSHDAIMGTTLDGLITSWNPGAERLYGYRAKEVLDRHVDLIIPQAERESEQIILDRISTGERVEQYEAQRVRKDGTKVLVLVTLSPIVDSTGAIVGVSSVSRDAGERRRAEAILRELLEAAPDAMVCADSIGQIAVVNAQAERLFGYSRDELVGQPIEVLVPENARSALSSHLRGYLTDPRGRPMGPGKELAGRRKDGSEFPAEISLSALETEDGVLVSAAIRDVTDRLEALAERERLKAEAERERLESQLHQSQRLESLGQLAGGVAHDFNNLLAVIGNYADFVSEEVARAAGEDSERWAPVRDDVAQIQHAAERATRLTHQLLAFGRRNVVRPEVLSLNKVVREVEHLLRRSIGEHVDLTTSLAPDLQPVMVDPGQIEQVLVNLVVNARDAMPGGGTLTIDTENVIVDENYSSHAPGLRPGSYVRLRVGDTGTGMDDQVIRRAFEPFFTTKPKGEGSGLGLATVYGIITQAGGAAHIYSEPGRGTTFTALFPVTGQVVSRAPTAPRAERQAGGETVLVVEDEEAMREVTRRILTRNGYEVITAAGGAEAIEIAQQRDCGVDLLLTDVVMPEMLGKEVAASVLAVRPDVRVLYMSGYAHPVLTSQGTLEAGVTLVEKPFSEDSLLAKAREVLDANTEFARHRSVDDEEQVRRLLARIREAS